MHDMLSTWSTFSTGFRQEPSDPAGSEVHTLACWITSPSVVPTGTATNTMYCYQHHGVGSKHMVFSFPWMLAFHSKGLSTD